MTQAPDFVIQIIKKYWQLGQKILEIGCGPAFLRSVFGTDYIGTDITDAPYTKNMPRDVDIVCPADNLLAENNSIDIVVIKSAFFLFDDHKKSLEEIKRVLRPGGRVIIFDYNRKTQQKLQQTEGHCRYPCWTQWGLSKLLQQHKFTHVTNLIAATEQPTRLAKLYHFLRQEILGTWAIVCGTKII